MSDIALGVVPLEGQLAMKPLRSTCPRLAELTATRNAEKSRESYFEQFCSAFASSPLARVYFVQLEEELERLDRSAWSDLKDKTEPHLWKTQREAKGLTNLLSVLNERKGYILLRDLGFASIRFLPENSKTRMPDLEATNGSGLDAVLELKTIRKSDEYWKYVAKNDELLRQRKSPQVEDVRDEANNGLRGKFQKGLESAQGQLLSYRSEDRLRRIVAVVLELDNDPCSDLETRETEKTLCTLGLRTLNSSIEGFILRPGYLVPFKYGKSDGVT